MGIVARTQAKQIVVACAIYKCTERVTNVSPTPVSQAIFLIAQPLPVCGRTARDTTAGIARLCRMCPPRDPPRFDIRYSVPNTSHPFLLLDTHHSSTPTHPPKPQHRQGCRALLPTHGPAMSQNSTALRPQPHKIKIPKAAASYTPATMDQDLRSQLNVQLVAGGHDKK